MNKLTSPVLIADIPYHNADLNYLVSPFLSSDPIICLKRGRRVDVVVGGMEAERAKRVFNSRNVKVWTPAELKTDDHAMRSISDWSIGLLRKIKHKGKVFVGSNFPLGIARDIKKTGVKIEVCADLFPERQVKRPDELNKIKDCQRVAVKCMRTAVGMLRDASVSRSGTLFDHAGTLTSERVKRKIHEIMLENDCMGHGTIVACGRDAADPHESGRGALRAGETIVMDIFPRNLNTGYWGDLSRTVIKGKASNYLAEMHNAVRKAQALAISKIKPGIPARRIYDQVMDYFNSSGFITTMSGRKMEGFIHSVGHGLGMDVHEVPSIGLQANRLRKGQVVTVEPGLYYRGIGGVRIEDVVVITTDGCRILHRCPHVFQV